MDDELWATLRDRELRSQHLPKTPTRMAKLDEVLWTLHDDSHQDTRYAQCETCKNLWNVFMANYSLPLTAEGLETALRSL